LVIEAVVETLEVKKDVFQHVQELLPATALLASNTSALSISDISAATKRPDQVVGLHFFNPADRMQLVEVIAGRQTSETTVRRARRFVQQLGKFPVISKDSPGFIVNRILFPYLTEAARLVSAGTPPDEIDKSITDFGMSMGPLRVMDEIGLDVVLQITDTLGKHFGERACPPVLLREMVQRGDLGKKTGRGFYAYDTKPGSEPSTLGETSTPASGGETLRERLLLLLINEAARCVEESIADGPEAIDFAMIMGTGFPAGAGGPLRYADSMGLAQVVATLKQWTAAEDQRYAPCELLLNLARKAARFHKVSGSD
jgi:3-hydroxyacyl-CoA dehydrogenase/enoyl-CoA hydratase/3-hydroxybutyryl-CoA epimerase